MKHDLTDIGTREIRTERLLLRRMRPEDAQPFMKNGLFWGSLEEIQKGVDGFVEQYNAPHNYHWVFEYNGEPIGFVHAWEVKAYDACCQLGYEIAEAYQKQGFMTEALKPVLLYLLNEVRFNRVYCLVKVHNIASCSVCRKVGMTLEGVLRQHFNGDEGFSDVNVFSLIQADLQDPQKLQNLQA